MENTEENKKEEAGKIQKNYDNTLKKLVAVLGGEDKLFPVKKIDKGVLGDIVTGLVKDQKEELEKKVKDGITGLLNKHMELKKSVKAKEDELKKLVEQKQKDFTEEAQKLFKQVEDIDNIEKSYYESLKSVTE